MNDKFIRYMFFATFIFIFKIAGVFAYEIETHDYTNPTPSKNANYNNWEYVIDKYDVDIIVNDNNSFDITENIVAYYNYPKHGIMRIIPLKNKISRLDGTTSINRAKISNLSVSGTYSTSREQGNYMIKIGSPDLTLTGENEYTIKYNYNIGKDPLKDKDELYLNIIGNDWDTVIGNVTFRITMPKNFDSSKLGFSAGYIGSVDSDKVKYEIDGNTIFGTYDGILRKNEALTIRCELPEGYFDKAKTIIDYKYLLLFLIPIMSFILSTIIWLLFGKNKHVVETVEFYPPEGLNSLELGYLYNGRVDNKDIVSLLIYLADKKYISIIEGEQDFTIVKLKDYDGDNKYEKLFFNGLFNNSNHQTITSKKLEKRFYKTANRICDTIKKDNKLFQKRSKFSFGIVFLVIIPILYLCLIPFIEYNNITSSIILIVGCSFFGFFYSILFYDDVEIYWKLFVAGFISFGASAFIPGFIPQELRENPEPVYIYALIVTLISEIAMIVLYNMMKKRTEYGNELYGKVKGFRRFLKIAEKEQLESIVEKNPSYFYNILPYTYVLGLSSKWISKFENIAIEPPNWYKYSGVFSLSSFSTSFNNTMKIANINMSPRTISSGGSSSSSGSSSGGSSGGGSSGGGSGGGGGRSW